MCQSRHNSCFCGRREEKTKKWGRKWGQWRGFWLSNAAPKGGCKTSDTGKSAREKSCRMMIETTLIVFNQCLTNLMASNKHSCPDKHSRYSLSRGRHQPNGIVMMGWCSRRCVRQDTRIVVNITRSYCGIIHCRNCSLIPVSRGSIKACCHFSTLRWAKDNRLL